MLGFRPTASTKLDIGNNETQDQTIFKEFATEPEELTLSREPWWLGENVSANRNLNATLFLEAMASCTAITYVNGELVGDPLDVKMFEKTGWTLDETE